MLREPPSTGVSEVHPRFVHADLIAFDLDKVWRWNLDWLRFPSRVSALQPVMLAGPRVSMRNLTFGFFDDGLPRDSRVLMFYSFETEENFSRSGILHYNLGERRFMGPRHDRELTSAALVFLEQAGRLNS